MQAQAALSSIHPHGAGAAVTLGRSCNQLMPAAEGLSEVAQQAAASSAASASGPRMVVETKACEHLKAYFNFQE